MPQQGGINAPYTRFRGPLLIGQSSDFGVAAVNGGSTAPLISFWNASEHGFYVTSTAITNFVTPGAASALILTSAGTGVGCSGLQSTAAVTMGLYISQSSGALFTSSGGGAAPAAVGVGAYLVFDNSRNKLCIYSTQTGWLGTAPMTSS